MKFLKDQLIKIVISLTLVGGMLFANFFAVRMMLTYGVDTYFYDKLLVAYTVGGGKGLKLELDKIPVTDKLRRETVLAKDFAARLGTLSEPDIYLQDKVQQYKNLIVFIKNLRSIVIILMLIIFVWQSFAKSSLKLKSKKSP